MGGFTMKGEYGRDNRTLNKPIADTMLMSHMRCKSDVHIIEPAITHKIGSADELFFCRGAKDFQGTLQTKLLHGRLRRKRC